MQAAPGPAPKAPGAAGTGTAVVAANGAAGQQQEKLVSSKNAFQEPNVPSKM